MNSLNVAGMAHNNLFNNNSVKIKLATLLAFWLACFFPVYPSLIHTWLNNSNNSHGILVPLICLYLIWQKKDKLRQIKISTSMWGAVILIISIMLYLLSYAGQVAVISRSMVALSLIGLLWFTLGTNFFKLLAFPLFFLLFMVPVPDSVLRMVAFPLQLFATKISAFIIQTLSITVYREGNMLYFAQTQLEVAEACSGIRSIISFLMLSVIFIYMMDKGWVRKMIILFSVIPLALFANIVRITGTGILAHFFGPGIARGFLHEFSGMAVFAFGFMILLLEYLLLKKISAKGVK